MPPTPEPTTSGELPDAPEPSQLHGFTDDPAARNVGEPPRATMSVGRLWMVAIVCLLVGGLLNAPGIRKTALGQPVGWRRNVATFFADPLYDVSHALYLDRLRVGIQDLIGRKGDDNVDLTLPSPIPTTVPVGPTTTTTIPKPAFSPTHMARLWVGGDSLSIEPGESIINQAVATQAIGILQSVDGHVSTGLARPEVFNWPAYLSDVIKRESPDAMVLTIGSNDDQTLTGVGGVGPLGSPAWQAEYRRRVGGLMDEVTASGKITLFWVDIPEMRNVTRYETRYKMINSIIRSEAEARPGRVYFVDIVPTLAGPDGGYADYLTNRDGTVVPIRSGDGIHFERAGADRVATAVLAVMHQAFDLTSWRTATTTTTAPPGKNPAKKKTTTTTSTTSTTSAG